MNVVNKIGLMVVLLIGIFAYCKLDERKALGQEHFYQEYHCVNFQIGDIVVADCPFDKEDQIVGVVKKIEPKPTNEKIHWITIKNTRTLFSKIYSEDYVKLIKRRNNNDTWK